MSKHTKKETINSSSTALIVPKPDISTKKFAKHIERILKIRGIYLKPVPLAGQRKEFVLRGGTVGCFTRDKQREQDVWIIPLTGFSAAGSSYWVTISIIFAPQATKYKLEQVKIMVFKGEVDDIDKEPFFRAEWYAPESGDKNAQPHWHVYKTVQEASFADFEPNCKNDTTELKTFGEEKSVAEEVKAENKKQKPFSKFHFAMAAEWHKNHHQHQINFHSEESLINWLTGCITYIRDQLIFLE